MKNTHKRYWAFSSTASLLLSLLLMYMFYSLDHLRDLKVLSGDGKVAKELMNEASIHKSLTKWRLTSVKNDWPLKVVPTGLFIQSVRFESASEVSLTGYIWQTYTDGVHDGISRGFVLPESIDSADTAVQEEVYRKRVGSSETIGWYFERNIRQSYSYKDFPFDYKTVHLRMWHNDFADNVVLTPALDSYKSTDVMDIFGIDDSIALAGWNILNTYYSYDFHDYDTNFGLSEYAGQEAFPELNFNILVKREILNPLIIFLVPMLVVMALLFAILMATTLSSETQDVSGFNVLSVYGAYSALLFTVIIAHSSLRENYPVSEFFYIEYFYVLIYSIIVFLTLNTHYCLSEGNRITRWLHQDDHLMVKILFWPVSLFSLDLITFITLF
ncbi:hypothetical protein [Magnetococcus sp. PR-3]|uniref:hypothetical protein n=1 Tax=Magnetococcus sp. PR-3 TaxID=3120355 RepID=UPI002FCE1FB9